MYLTAGEATSLCGGKLVCGDPGAVISVVSTDSRKIAPGTLFVPIKGERTDAHGFIPAVFAAGASATLTQDVSLADGAHPFIFVQDSQQALQALAAAYRSRFTLPVVGITGSVGKTTTKEFVALALSAGHNVMKTQGNFNSQVGLPLTMFQLLPEHTAAVIEMGMSDFGEMARLAQIARPRYAVMTNIGVSHIAQLGTQKNILHEKLHITDCFDGQSVLFLNGDDPFLAGLRETLPQVHKIYFGTTPWCQYRAQDIVSGEDGCSFVLDAEGTRRNVALPVPGMHNVLNAMAALAVAKTLGVELGEAAAALAAYEPLAMRQQIHKANGVTVIDDSYNASPDSVKSSLQMLCSMPGNRHIAVLADMMELGGFEAAAHCQVGEFAAQAGVDLLLAVGERAKGIAVGARSKRPELDCRECGSNAQAVEVLKGLLTGGDVVLVKGSRSMKTDEIVRVLL